MGRIATEAAEKQQTGGSVEPLEFVYAVASNQREVFPAYSQVGGQLRGYLPAIAEVDSKLGVLSGGFDKLGIVLGLGNQAKIPHRKRVLDEGRHRNSGQISRVERGASVIFEHVAARAAEDFRLEGVEVIVGDVNAHAELMRFSDPGQVMGSRKCPVVPVIRFPGIQTAHPAETLNGDAGKTAIADIPGWRVGSGDAEDRFAKGFAKSGRQGVFRHAVKADMAS